MTRRSPLDAALQSVANRVVTLRTLTVVGIGAFLVCLILAKRASTKSGDYLKRRHASSAASVASTSRFYLTLAILVLLLT